MPLQPRKNMAGLEKGTHGGLDYAELERKGIAPDELLDFSVCTNPVGVPPGILQPVPLKEVSRYPDSQSTGLKRVIAAETGVPEDRILAGSGSTEIIRLAALAYLDEADTALIIEPTYGEYRLACEISGCRVLTFTASAKDDFRLDVDALVSVILNEKPKAVFLCNPNNPTGYYLDVPGFQRILAAIGDALVVLDEAYVSFVRERWDSTQYIDSANLLVVRSMTKDYAIAGLRLGYGMAKTEITGTLRSVCPPWNVNAVAQQAGIAALQDREYLEKSREMVHREKAYLTGQIEKLGLRCVPSASNFFLVEVGHAADFRSRLLQRKLLVRDCTSFGLPGYLRIAPGNRSKNRRLVAALKELVNE